MNADRVSEGRSRDERCVAPWKRRHRPSELGRGRLSRSAGTFIEKGEYDVIFTSAHVHAGRLHCHLAVGVRRIRGPRSLYHVVGNPITGEGLPNPAPTVMANWGNLPEGREWGSTAGIDIDPTDGQVWAYERCGASNFGAGAPVNCDNNLVDPIFKFDRNTGEVLANFGAGLFVTPHGIHVDSDGNVWVTDFAGNADGTKGHQVFKFSPTGEVLLTLGSRVNPEASQAT